MQFLEKLWETELSYNKNLIKKFISNRNAKNTDTHEQSSLFWSIDIGDE